MQPPSSCTECIRIPPRLPRTVSSSRDKRRKRLTHDVGLVVSQMSATREPDLLHAQNWLSHSRLPSVTSAFREPSLLLSWPRVCVNWPRLSCVPMLRRGGVFCSGAVLGYCETSPRVKAPKEQRRGRMGEEAKWRNPNRRIHASGPVFVKCGLRGRRGQQPCRKMETCQLLTGAACKHPAVALCCFDPPS